MKGNLIRRFILRVMGNYHFGKIEIQKGSGSNQWTMFYTDPIFSEKSRHNMIVDFGTTKDGCLFIKKLVWHPGDKDVEKTFNSLDYHSVRSRLDEIEWRYSLRGMLSILRPEALS